MTLQNRIADMKSTNPRCTSSEYDAVSWSLIDKPAFKGLYHESPFPFLGYLAFMVVLGFDCVEVFVDSLLVLRRFLSNLNLGNGSWGGGRACFL